MDKEKHKNITMASFLWLLDQEAICDDNYQDFLKIKRVRNRYAHELLGVIFEGIPLPEVELFGKMLNLYRKIDNRWTLNIEVAIDVDVVPDGADLSEARSAAGYLIDLILEVIYNSKSTGYKEILEKLKCRVR